jgi:hypothetical protein
MERKQIDQVIDTMSVMEQARALRGMHQAMALGNLVDGIVSRVRGWLGDARRGRTPPVGAPTIKHSVRG